MADASAEPNLAALLVEHPFADDEPLLFGTDRTWTAGEARAEVTRLVAELDGAGLDAGAAVAGRVTGGAAVLAMTACWRHGAVYIPVNDRMPETAVADLLASTGAAAVIDSDGMHRLEGTAGFDAGAAFVLFTSGTTGEPTPIVHHHEAYLEIIDRVLGPLSASRDRTKRPSPNLIPVPMALNAGIYNALFGLRAGAPLVLMDRFTTHGFAELVTRHGIRSTVLPPASIAMLNDDPAIESLAPLRYVRSITAPLSPFQARRFTDRFGTFVLNGYGQAELGEVVGWTAADAKEHPGKIGAVGRAHPGVEIRIADADGNWVGELLVKPPTAPSASVAGTLGDRLGADGFVRTGDVGRVDDDGFVWIEGRTGELINRGGNKVFPDEVEEVLGSVPGVTEAAVVGRPDERLGEVPVAFVVGEVEFDTLEAACRAELVPYKVPVEFIAADALPRNDAGKLLRRELHP